MIRCPAPLFVLGVALVCALSAARASTSEGVQLDIIVSESIDADPPETAVIDSASYLVSFGQMTTVRAGNFVADIIVDPRAAGAVHLQTMLNVFGPSPSTHSDEATIEPGAALVVSDINGKGKSHYRARFVPRRAPVPDRAVFSPDDTAAWQPVYSVRVRYFLPPGVLPPLQFTHVRGALDYEYEMIFDSLDFEPGTRLTVYLSHDEPATMPFEGSSGFCLDPTRLRIVAAHSTFATRVDSRALILTGCYRWWGYAPALLSEGMAGHLSFADYYVKRDHGAGYRIALDSLARTLDFDRHDPEIAFNHAASFVTWLINTHGLPRFKTFYDRATDLSIHRAIWSVYGRTLGEMEGDWLGYLKTRKFHRDEIEYFARRERAFRHYEESLALYREAADVEAPAPSGILREIGITEAHLGRWNDAAVTFQRLANEYPEEYGGVWLLAEAQRAAGNDQLAGQIYAQLLSQNTSVPQSLMRMGDIQWEARRVDSAAGLWKRAMAENPRPLATAELQLRLGRYFEGRRRGADSARTYFNEARRIAGRIISNDPTDAVPWLVTAEALFGLDSIPEALGILSTAETLSDAPVDVGRLRLLQGHCYDKMGRREEALAAYVAALASRAEEPVARIARKHVNANAGR